MVSTPHAVSCILHSPPLFTTVRVNLLNRSIKSAKQRLQEIFDEQYRCRGRMSPVVSVHPQLPDVLFAKGDGPCLEIVPGTNEIYCDLKVATSVARGSDVFCAGVLGSAKHFESDECVALYADLTGRVLRGHKSLLTDNKLFLGNGQTTISRHDIFHAPDSSMAKERRGTAVFLREPLWNQPSFGEQVVEDWGYCQNLPSIVSVHVLDPQPGEIVLDMCSCPGGKSTHIASLMKDQGRLICLDRGPGHAVKVMRRAIQFGHNSVEIFPFYDSTKACSSEKDPGSTVLFPPFPAESFDRILVDAPCSSLGRRPLLRKRAKGKELQAFQPVQRKLLTAAIGLIKRGGTLVYSTCTLRLEENEHQVKWLLETFPEMVPSAHKIIIGKCLSCADVSIEHIEDTVTCMQKFDPQDYCAKHGSEESGRCLDDPLCLNMCKLEHIFSRNYANELLSIDNDTIGFFIAKFVKL